MDYNKDSQKEMSKRVEASKTWTEKQIPLKGAPIWTWTVASEYHFFPEF